MRTHGYSLGPGWKGIFAQLGVPPDDVLRRVGLPEDLLNHDQPRVRAEQFFTFSAALEESVDDAEFPLLLLEAMSPEYFSPPLFAALCSPNLETAADRLSRFKPLIAPIDLTVMRDVSGLRLEFRWHRAGVRVPAWLSGMEVLFIVKLARIGTRHDVRPTRIQVPEMPPSAGSYEEWLGVRMEAGSSLSVSFGEEDATRPFLSANGSMWEIFEPELRRRLADLEGSATIEERTRAILLEALPSGQVTLDAVARRLATSSRSLQRKLRDEGTSFKEVVRGTRERLADDYLAHTQLSTTEIAYLLGFENTTSFFRAFHSWTGSTPDAVRRGRD